MARIILLIFSFIIGNQLKAQTTQPKMIAEDVLFFDVDKLGNLYLVSKNGQLKKLNAEGDSVAVFNELRQFGKLHDLDVSNPLKIVLYFQNFGTVVWLDRFLNKIGSINLRSNGVLQTSAVATSYDNQLWVFDDVNFKLKKINDQGNVLQQTADLRLVNDELLPPQKIIDQNKMLFLYHEKIGWFVFDYYGALQQYLPFKNWSAVAVQQNTLLGWKDDVLIKYHFHLKTSVQKSITIAKGLEKIVAAFSNIYFLKNGILYILQEE